MRRSNTRVALRARSSASTRPYREHLPQNRVDSLLDARVEIPESSVHPRCTGPPCMATRAGSPGVTFWDLLRATLASGRIISAMTGRPTSQGQQRRRRHRHRHGHRRNPLRNTTRRHGEGAGGGGGRGLPRAVGVGRVWRVALLRRNWGSSMAGQEFPVPRIRQGTGAQRLGVRRCSVFSGPDVRATETMFESPTRSAESGRELEHRLHGELRSRITTRHRPKSEA